MKKIFIILLSLVIYTSLSISTSYANSEINIKELTGKNSYEIGANII